MQIILLIQMCECKWWHIAIAGLVLIFSVLWPYIIINKTEKVLQKDQADKNQQIIDLQREVAELKDTNRSLNIQISKCIERLDECTLVVEDYERKVEKLEYELLQGQVKDYDRERKVEKLEDEIKLLQGQVKDYERNVEKLEDEIKLLQGQVKDYERKVEKLKDEINLLQGQVKDYERKVEKLEDENQGQVKDYERKVEKLEDENQGQVKDYERKVEKLEDENQGQVKDYERKVEKLEDEIKLLQGQVHANRKEFATCQQQLGDYSARNHISIEMSRDRDFYIILFGIIAVLFAVLFGGYCCCSFIGNTHDRIISQGKDN